MNEEVLGTEEAESPSVTEANDENLGNRMFENLFGESLTPEASEDPDSSHDDVQEEEESTDELVEDASDDKVEVDETDVEDDDDLAVNSEADIDVLPYEDLFDQVGAIEIGGKNYTPAQLKSILGQEESAGTKAREASAKLREAEEVLARAAQQEQWVEQRMNGVQHSDQLLKIDAEIKEASEIRARARDEGDMYEVAVQKERIEVLKEQREGHKAEVDAVNKRVNHEKIQALNSSLETRGVGYLVSDKEAVGRWVEYVSNTGITQEEFKTAQLSPAIAEAFEKARKYDAAQTKGGKKISSSKKTLKAGTGKKITSTATKKGAERKTRLKKGQGTPQDVNEAALNVANSILGL